MDGFLNKVSDYIFSNYSENIDELCIVLPNRRAGLFLKNFLSEKSAKPIWSPEIFPMEDFIWELSGLQKADQAEQLFVFYSAYKKFEKEKAESFEQFCKWAPTLLNDFNETDYYLADIHKLFGNLSDIKGIENWSLGEATLTEFQKQYLHFWSAIGNWYGVYKKQLLENSIANPGLATRIVAENIAEYVSKKKWKKIIFAGFNSLNAAEEKIVSVLRENGKADVLWDADYYYLNDKSNEAGKFLRDYQKKYFRPIENGATHFEHVEDILSTTEKNITVVGVARMVSQAKAASYFVNQFDAKTKFTLSTAIVLGDEQLLLPLLHALPEEAKEINITMGFPLKNSPIASLVNLIFQLQLNAQRFNIFTREGELKFYHGDIIRLIRHPYIKQLFSQNSIAEKIDEYIPKHNIIFSSVSQLKRIVENEKHRISEKDIAALHLIFQPWNETSEAVDGLGALIEMLRSAFSKNEKEDDFSIEKEYLFQLQLMLNRARSLHEKWHIQSDLKSLRALLEQQIISAQLPFEGEPLSGLQIMGVLETRTLDFENLILLSANENVIPAAKTQQTFILYDLRKHFGLPTWEEKDAISAYHFYRMITRAKNIFILHNTDTDLFGNKEKSRFVSQIIYELPLINKKIKIEEVVFDAGLPQAVPDSVPILVPKNEHIFQKLNLVAEKGFSPTSLNAYRNCSLQFYFQYVAGLHQVDEVEETIGANTLGTIIHGVLEELYKPVVGFELSLSFFDDAKKKVPDYCDGMFAKHFSKEESSYGKNYLAKQIAVNYVQKYLEQEKKLFKAENKVAILGLETKLEHFLEIKTHQIKLYGKADRIDSTKSGILLLDYKTGNVDKNELKIRDWSDILANSTVEKSFQLLMYAWLYAKMNPNTSTLSSGIISFKKLSEGYLMVSTPNDENLIGKESLLKFEDALKKLLEDIFDLEKQFVQTEDSKICKNCNFRNICRR